MDLRILLFRGQRIAWISLIYPSVHPFVPPTQLHKSSRSFLSTWPLHIPDNHHLRFLIPFPPPPIPSYNHTNFPTSSPPHIVNPVNLHPRLDLVEQFLRPLALGPHAALPLLRLVDLQVKPFEVDGEAAVVPFEALAVPLGLCEGE